MKPLKPEERFHLLLEMGDGIFNHLSENVEVVLIVPNFKEEVASMKNRYIHHEWLEIQKFV